ncbi:hypothetical protein AAAC51_30580 [Priestia megaterium]
MNKKKIGLLAFITMLAIGMLIGCSSTNKENSADEKVKKQEWSSMSLERQR